jgi:beta-glucosidase
MAQATFNFPRGFLWGTATSSHQVEGNNKNNNWWAWEQQPGRILDGHTSGLACDWWGGRWKEDFDRAAESGQNAHRLSIEWSRIQPAPDRWDEHALDHYIEMLRGLNERNLTPMVTLHHFSDPVWLAERGGWENDETPALFAAYVEKVVPALKDYVTLWCTINEPNVYAYFGYVVGCFPPGKQDISLFFRVLANMVRGHARAFAVIRKAQPVSRIGIATNYRDLVPEKSWSPLDRAVAGLQARLYNDLFPRALQDGVLRLPVGRVRIPEAKGTQDYLGLNYYSQDRVAFSLLAARELFGRRSYPPEAQVSETGLIANRPAGMWRALGWAHGFGLPVIIAENGVEDSEDILRPRYLAEHLRQVWRAVNFNWPIKGYFHWTLADNFEWERGWTQRFGLWALDRETQARRRRPSADLYAAICQTNSLSSEMVAKYAPDLLAEMFPG